jgi:hypothetical protein
MVTHLAGILTSETVVTGSGSGSGSLSFLHAKLSNINEISNAVVCFKVSIYPTFNSYYLFLSSFAFCLLPFAFTSHTTRIP